MGDAAPYTSDALRRKHSRAKARVEQRDAGEALKKRMSSGFAKRVMDFGGSDFVVQNKPSGKAKTAARAKSAAILKKHAKKPAKGETVAQLKSRIRTHNKRHCLKVSGNKATLKSRLAHAKA